MDLEPPAKVFPQNLGCAIPTYDRFQHSVKVFSTNLSLLTDLCKVSPSKISHYTVYIVMMRIKCSINFKQHSFTIAGSLMITYMYIACTCTFNQCSNNLNSPSSSVTSNPSRDTETRHLSAVLLTAHVVGTYNAIHRVSINYMVYSE